MRFILTALVTIAIFPATGADAADWNLIDETQRGDPDQEVDVRSSAGDGLELDARVRPFKLNFGALQDDSTELPLPTDDWRVNFNTWIWMIGLDGDIGVRGLTVDVSAHFGDILDASDSIFAFSGRLEIGKGRWGGFIDGMFAKIGVDNVSGPFGFVDVDVTYEIVMVDLGLMYQIGEWTPDGEAARNSRDATVDLYAGARYTSLDLKLKPRQRSSRSKTQEWIDPIVGAKLVFPISEKWHIRANGDIGGFGVESDLTWSVTAVFGYDFTLFNHPATAYLGYRAIGQDFTEGSGNDRFTWDVIQHGPLLGFSLFF